MAQDGAVRAAQVHEGPGAGRRHHDGAVRTGNLGLGAGHAQDRGHGAAGQRAGIGVTADDDVAGDLDGHGAAVNQEGDGGSGAGVRGGEAQDGRLGVGLSTQAGQALGAHGLGDGGRLSDRRLSNNLGRGRGTGLTKTALALGGLGRIDRRLLGVGDDVELAGGLLGLLRRHLLGGLLDVLGGGLGNLLGVGGARGGAQRHRAVAGRGEELGLDGGQVHGRRARGGFRQLLAGVATRAALVVRNVGVDEEAHRVDGHRGEGLDLVERATDADLASLDAVGGGHHPRDLVAVNDRGLEGLPLTGVEGPGPDRVGPDLLGDLAGGAHAQLNAAEDRQVGLLAGAVEQEGVTLLSLNVGQPRLGVGAPPHHVGRRVREVERNQRRAEGTRDEHRALPAAQEASNLKHQLLPSLRGTRRAVSIDAGRTG